MRSFLALPNADRRLVMEAFFMTILARAALRMVAFTTVQRWIRRSRTTASDARTIERIRWAVMAISRRCRSTCLTDALVAHEMLRRRGLVPVLQLGVRRRVRALEAHAWVECAGRTVVGGPAPADDYARLS